MAKKAKAKPAATGAVQRPSSADVQRAVGEVQKHKKEAADYTGMAGQATKAFCERWNVDKHAFGFVRKLAGMDPQKRQSVLIDTADLCKKMGFSDQADMFVDVGGAVDGLAGDGEEDGPTDEEIKARTEAEIGESIPQIDRSAEDRIRGEIGAAVGSA